MAKGLFDSTAFRHLSLGAKTSLVFAFYSLLMLTLLGILIHRDARKDTAALAEARIEGLTLAAESYLHASVDAIARDIGFLARNPPVQALAEAVGRADPDELRQHRAIVERLTLHFVPTRRGIYEARLIDARTGLDVVRIARTPPFGPFAPIPPRSQPDQDTLRALAAHPPGRLFVSDVFWDRSGGEGRAPPRSTLQVAQAVSGPDGRPLLYVLFQMSFQALAYGLSAATGETVETALFDGNGYLLGADSGAGVCMAPTQARQSIADIYGSVRIPEDEGVSGHLTVTPSSGRLAHLHRIRLYRDVDQSVILAVSPSHSVMPRSLAPLLPEDARTVWWSVALLALGVVLFIVLGRVLVSPLQHLIDRMHAYQLGDRKTRPGTGMLDRRDEFGALARGLLSMTLRAEAQMAATQAARAESQRVFETAADGMVIATADGMIEGFNRAAEKMFGWTAGEVMDRDWSMLVAAAGAPTLDQSLNLAEGGSVDGAADAGGYRRAPSHTVQALRRDGTPFPAALRITVLEARFRTRFLLTIRDLSNEVALELARSESAAKSRFLANMSHELRTPLNAVTLHAQMIADEADDSDNPVLMEGARQIQGAADHLLDLINGILDLARIQSGRLDLNPAPMDLGMFVDGLKTIGSALARKQGNAFVIETEGLPATVVLDRVRLRQCALNLISNAAKFTKHGTITLSLTLSPGTLRLRVSDTGVGMSAEELGRIFQMFEQANGYVHAAHGGSGVGLALTRTIVEMMDGSIAVESAPNEGSCFEIAVPLAALGSEAGAVAQAARAAQDAPACAVPATDGLAHPALSGQPAALPQPVGVQGAPDHPAPGVIGACTILIVEDDVTLLHAIARAVSQMGLLTELAETAEDARRYLETTVPDMVVLDLALPQARGEEIIRLMKADPRLTETPITVITALDLSRAHAMWLTAQCHAVLRKGDFDLADLTAELTDIVRVCGDTAQAGNAPDTAGRTAPKNERGRSDDTRAFG